MSKFRYDVIKHYSYTSGQCKFYFDNGVGDLVNKFIIYSKNKICPRNLRLTNIITNESKELIVYKTKYDDMYMINFGNQMLNCAQHNNKKYMLCFDHHIDADTDHCIIMYSLSLIIYDNDMLDKIKNSQSMTFNYDPLENFLSNTIWDIDLYDHDAYLELMKDVDNLVVDQICWSDNVQGIKFQINGHDQLIVDHNQPYEMKILELLMNQKKTFFVHLEPRKVDSIKFITTNKKN